MRALIQRVRSASVEVEGETVAAIGAGMLVLLGVSRTDSEREAERMASKLAKLRIFEDSEGRANEPIGQREILCISQFTLYGDTRRGNRPSFVEAAEPALAQRLYEIVCERLGARRGVFGARMAVELVNDGPMSVLVDV